MLNADSCPLKRKGRKLSRLKTSGKLNMKLWRKATSRSWPPRRGVSKWSSWTWSRVSRKSSLNEENLKRELSVKEETFKKKLCKMDRTLKLELSERKQSYEKNLCLHEDTFQKGTPQDGTDYQ